MNNRFTSGGSSKKTPHNVPSDNTASPTRFERLARLREYWNSQYDRFNTEYEDLPLPPEHPIKRALGERCQNAIGWWVILSRWSVTEAPEGVEVEGVMYI